MVNNISLSIGSWAGRTSYDIMFDKKCVGGIYTFDGFVYNIGIGNAMSEYISISNREDVLYIGLLLYKLIGSDWWSITYERIKIIVMIDEVKITHRSNNLKELINSGY